MSGHIVKQYKTIFAYNSFGKIFNIVIFLILKANFFEKTNSWPKNINIFKKKMKTQEKLSKNEQYLRDISKIEKFSIF